MKLLEDISIHDTLNPKLWDVTTKQLLPEVRKKIIEIVQHFEDYIEVPIRIADIQIVGSNASYNYTDKSDVDVHIIANYDVISKETELLQNLYNSKKQEYNRKFDIGIKGVNVELYVQDIKSGVTSNGIYSVCDNRWVKEPKPIKNFKQHDNSKEVDKWSSYVRKLINEKRKEPIQDALDTLYLIRHNSLNVDGEFGKGNQMFKELRNRGIIDQLRDALEKAVSKELSLESMTKGQLVNRFKNDN